MKHKFGQVWLPTQVMGFGPLITSHKSPWPNGQGVGLLIRRLWVRVPQGMQFYVALYSDQEAMKQRCADSVLAAPLPEVGSLDRVSAQFWWLCRAGGPGPTNTRHQGTLLLRIRATICFVSSQ